MCSVYAHSDDRLRIKTVHGALVTILGALLASVLFIEEFHRCMRVRVDQQMSVDTQRRATMHVNFNITFPALPCQAIMIDTGDVSGRYETEAMAKSAHDGEVHKWRLDADGRHIDLDEYISPQRGPDIPFLLNINFGDIQQVKEAVIRHEGCNLYGWFEVQRVAGNIHFGVRNEAAMAVGNDHFVLKALLQRHIQLNGGTDKTDGSGLLLNASHIIHTLRFGPSYPGQVHPLEGVARIDRKATGVDKYFIKVVPTDWQSGWGSRPISTYQYSITEYYAPLHGRSDIMPGVLLLYDSWPIRVKLRQHRLGLFHLLVRTCAVVGGVWAVTSATDKLVHQAVSVALKALKGSAAP